MDEQNKNIIPNEKLKPQSSLLLAPSPQDNTNYAGLTGGVADSILNEYTNYKTATENLQNTQANTGTDILSLMNEISGKTGATATANETAGVNTATADVNKYAQQLADLNAQASVLNREAQAIPIQVQEQFKNTGATDRGVAPIETGRLRENAIRALSIAQQSDIASAALTGSSVRLNAAKEKAQQIVDLQFKPIEDRLAIKKQQYELNKEILDKYDKKRSEALDIALKKEEADIAEKKQNAKDIQSIAIKIAEFGGDPNIIKNAKTPLEAISIAGNKLQDPVQKLQMQKLRNDIAKQQEEARILKQYGGLSPEEWARKQEEALKGLDAAKSTAKDLENQKKQVETILNSTAINSVVGPTAISRSRGGRLTRALLGAGAGAVAGAPLGLVGAIPGAVVGGIAGATLPGISDEVSGRADDLVALTEQMLSQQFLDKLIQVKGQGATFGALTDREGNSLRSAANAISQTAIRDKNDKVIGYDMSENEFRRQFGIMQDAITLAEMENTGKVINDSEDADLETLWQTGGALVAPANYYQ